MKALFFVCVLMLVLNLQVSAQKNEQAKKAIAADSIKANDGFPVAPFGDTLFYLYEGVGPMKAQTRATMVSRRIEILDLQGLFQADSFRIEPYESNEYVVYSDIPILTVTDADAKHENMSQVELAQKRMEQIREATQQYHNAFSLRTLIKKILLLALLLVIVSALIFGINRLFKFLYSFIENRLSTKMQGMKVGAAKLSSSQQLTGLILRTAKWAKVVVILILIYISLPAIIYLVPASEGITNTLLDYTLTPIKNFFFGFLDFIPNLITIAVIVVIFILFIRLFKIFAEQIRDGSVTISGFYPDWAMSTFNILRFVLYAFMFVVIFPYLPGSSSPVFQGVSVFLGFLISMGASSSVSNIISGIVITYMRAFQLGDRIRAGDVEGDVVEKSLLVTRIKTVKEEEISVPNSTLMNGTVKNYSKLAREGGLIIYTSVTIGYDAPWRDVHKALLTAADKTDLIQKEPKPFVLQMALNDFYVEYQINGYIHDAQKMMEIYSNLRQNIQDSFNEAGIEIMSAHYTNLRDGNKTTIPENYLPKDYERPGFKIDEKKSQ